LTTIVLAKVVAKEEAFASASNPAFFKAFEAIEAFQTFKAFLTFTTPPL
jgi:hypothetical protein